MSNNGESWKAAFPKPDWQAEDVLLYRGDCLEILPKLPDGCVDAVVTDPPYIGLTGGHNRDFSGGVTTRRHNTISIGDIWNAGLGWVSDAHRVGALGAIVFCSFRDVCDVLEAFLPCETVCLVTWYKRNSPPTGRNLPRYTNEHVWLLRFAAGMQWDAIHTTVFDIPMLQSGCMATERILNDTGMTAHPTQKPLSLMRELLQPVPHSTVDPFMGSGTTGVACIQTGRRFVGIELDPKYFATAVRRIKAAIRDDAGRFEFAKAKAPDPQMELIHG